MSTRKRRSVEETIWLYAFKKPSGCIEWHGAISKDGYGILTFWQDEKRTTTTAHRKVWELANGPVPDNLCVMHRCDNPACVNIDHLDLGTQEDNIRDMIRKNRANFFGRAKGKNT
jgi:hypothetical protein